MSMLKVESKQVISSVSFVSYNLTMLGKRKPSSVSLNNVTFFHRKNNKNKKKKKTVVRFVAERTENAHVYLTSALAIFFYKFNGL